MTNRINDWNLLILITIFILILSVFVGIFISNNQNTDSTENGAEVSPLESELPTSIINRENNFIATLDITIPENFSVLESFRNNAASGLDCTLNSSNTCQIYLISQLEGDVVYYLADSSPIQISENLIGATSKFTLELETENLEVTAEILRTVDESKQEGEIIDNTEKSTIPRQVYGCLNTVVCFNSGILSIDPVENDTQLKDFIVFLDSINK